MILRKPLEALSFLLIVLHVCSGQEESVKVYDENEWIPIAPKRVVEIDADKVNLQPKKAAPRVLNLNEPPQGNTFFPDEAKPAASLPGQPFQQYLRETSNIPYQKPPPPRPKPAVVHQPQHQHPYKFERIPPPNPRPVKDPPIFAFPSGQPQFAQVQFYQPEQYHTIPEEYLNQPVSATQQAQPSANGNYQTIHLQNVDIPDLPTLRVNGSSGNIHFPDKKQRKPQFSGPPLTSQKLGDEKENVQLLYVPLESLAPKVPHRLHAYQQVPVPEIQQQFDTYRPAIELVNSKQQQIKNIQSDFAKQAAEAHKLQLQFQQQPFALPVVDLATEPVTVPPTTTTTARRPVSKKRKAHQPPLAVYMGDGENADVTDVLALLKDAKTIEVHDSINPSSPKIFVGPSNLNAPRNYAKFELPYLSSIDTNRVERKVEQYPFFVAPLSYKTPPGYSKIPLPSPHVGSVVISHKEKITEKDATSKVPPHILNLPETYQLQPQYEFKQQEYPARPAIASTTPRYSKPIPEDQVINQYEIDQINSFIPQQQYEPEEYPSTQRVPEKYNIPQFKPRPTVSHFRFGTAVPPEQTQLSDDQLIDEILKQQQQQTKESQYQRPAPQQYDQYIHQTITPQFARPQQQYSQVVPEPVTRAKAPANRGRPATTPSVLAEEYEEHEIVKTTRAPNKVRTRPSQNQEFPTRTTSHLRARPPVTTTEAPVVDQYLKETIIESRPKTRPTESVNEETYQFVPVRSSTLAPFLLHSVSPVNLHQNNDGKIKYQFQEEEERQPIRPVIFKYKQSSNEDTHQNQEDISKFASTRGQSYSTPKSTQTVELNNANFVSGPQNVYQEDYVASNVKTQNANVENYNLEVHTQQPLLHQPQVHNIINNLEDQSVRQLLHPGLIPTSPKTDQYQHFVSSTIAPAHQEEVTTQAPTSNYPSTHLPVIQSTTRKPTQRGRQRGSRFTTTTEPSNDEVSRKTVTRGRRPVPIRPRYQDEDAAVTTTEYSARSTTDPTKKIVTASRSRFRTRGRPANTETTDRSDKLLYSTYSGDSTTIRVVTPRTNDQYDVQDYRQVYTAEEPAIYKKLVHKPATEPVVIHQINQLPIKNLEEENAESTSSKGSNRVRTRQRVSSTQAPQVVSSTSRRYDADAKENANEEEFYGFFREPNFKKVETETADTQRPVYSSTYVSSTPKYDRYGNEDDIVYQVQRQRIQPTTENLSTVNFVGEIRPKYQTVSYGPSSASTERILQSSTAAVDTKIRTRARLPSRRVTTESPDAEEASKTQRGRTRGKTHFRVPVKPKIRNHSGEDEDVEGGNYPAQFKAFQTSSTARPQFQITIDPQDDQDTYSSVYVPTYVSKDSGNKDATYVVENFYNPNLLSDNQKVSVSTEAISEVTDAPFALPSIATDNVNDQIVQSEQKEEDEFEKLVDDLLLKKEESSEDQNPEMEEITKVTTSAPETTTLKRRRGVWRLVKRPVDDFAVAESQNAAGNVNLIVQEEKAIEKVPEELPRTEESEEVMTTTIPEVETQASTTSTTENGFFDSIYNMFGLSKEEEQENSKNVTVTKEESVEVTTLPSVPETEETIATKVNDNEDNVQFTTPASTIMTYVTPMSLETWNKGILKTLTSTEISHETEICYKGKCIKSKDMKVPMT